MSPCIYRAQEFYHVRDFPDDEYNGVYSAQYKKHLGDASKWVLINNRPVFTKDEGIVDICIWWHEYRHWWIGSCENLGANNG